ncbi:MAG: phage holin family protein [Nitrospirae bacterium]|jgi:putative membrane protein|nr:phage holin family protein [Nitrospirota bacterium]
MAYLTLRIMINALSIAMAVTLIDDITFTGEWWKMIIIGAVFGLVNSLIKPFITIFALPLIILTLGLFTLIVNALMLTITAKLSGPLSLGLQIIGFWAAFKGALIISMVSILLSWVTGLKKIKIYRNK